MGRVLPPLPAANLVDRVVTYFRPQAGVARLRARAQLALTGGYAGARYDRKELKDWQASLGSADSDSLRDLPTLRAFSRDLARNNPIAGGAINTVVTNVIGPGLQPRPQPDMEALGLTEEAAAAWARDAERIWWAWADTPACDIERRQDFAGLQELVLRSQLESGDILAIRRFKRRPAELLGLKVQLVEADRISNPRNGIDGKRLRAGVEMDPDGAVVAFHVANRHPGEFLQTEADEWSRVTAYSASGQRQALHLYRRRRPGQTRGIPYLAPVIIAIKQLGRYTEAEIMAAVVSGMLTVLVKSKTGMGLDPVGPETDAAGQELDTEKEIGLGYGSMVDLQPDEEVEIVNPLRPNQAFDPFVTSILRQIGMALEIPFELLVKHFTASYSAARAALLEAWKAFRTQREFIAWNFCQPCYEWVIEEAIARGALAAPGFFRDPLIRQAWLATSWRGPAAGQIDPTKEIEAAQKRSALAISTLAEETAEITGGDWSANVAIRARERRQLVAAGLDVEPLAERIQTETTQTQQQAPDQDTAERREEEES